MSSVLYIGTILFGIPQTSIFVNAAITKSENNTYLGSMVLAENANTENAPIVYFDNNGNIWSVIGYNGNLGGVASFNGSLTLFLKESNSVSTFDNRYSIYNNIYSTSTLRQRIAAFESTLDTREKQAIIKRNLEVEEYDENSLCNGVSTISVDDAVMWPLSTKEAYELNPIPSEAFWLRSPGESQTLAAINWSDGIIKEGLAVQMYIGRVLPAFNLDLSYILFSTKVSENTYKLTIIDNANLNISLTSGSEIENNNNVITVPYTVADGTNRVSILVTDKDYTESDAQIKYYGSLNIDGEIGTSGTGSFQLPSDYDASLDKIYLIAEIVNDDQLTDYASTPLLIDLPYYTVKFDANSGSGTMADQGRIIGDAYSLTANAFSKEGYTFKNWNTSADGSGTSYVDGATGDLTNTVGSTVTLYAQWDINKYTVTWVDEDGAVLETDTDVEYGTIPTYDGETPTKPNTTEIVYTFAGWTPAVNAVTGDITYTATYSEEGAVYTITFDANGGTVTPTTGITNAEYKLTSLPVPSFEGYVFKGWFTVAEGGTQITTDTVFTANQTIYAQWEKEDSDSENTQNTDNQDTDDTKPGNSDGQDNQDTDKTEPENPNGQDNRDTDDAEPENPNNQDKTQNPDDIEPVNPNNPEDSDLPEEPVDPVLPQEPGIEVNENKTFDYLDELRTAIAIAISVGGEQTVYWDKGDSLPYDIMKTLEENPNITVIFEYSYFGEKYKVSISGKNVTSDINILWYGPLYLYSLYGIDITDFQSRGTYVVQKGDTLSNLAIKFNTSVKSLVALNQIKDPDLIYVGQVLKY